MTSVVDAHHHLLDPARLPAVAGTQARRHRSAVARTSPELAAAGIDRTILVQTIASLEETREFLATAAAVPFVGGVIGWVDLTDQEVGGTLDALRDGPGGEWLVGIRHQVHDEPDPDWLLRPDVRRGLATVEAAGLAYDLLVRSRECRRR
jgi:L-fuconolactonase